MKSLRGLRLPRGTWQHGTSASPGGELHRCQGQRGRRGRRYLGDLCKGTGINQGGGMWTECGRNKGSNQNCLKETVPLVHPSSNTSNAESPQITTFGVLLWTKGPVDTSGKLYNHLPLSEIHNIHQLKSLAVAKLAELYLPGISQTLFFHCGALFHPTLINISSKEYIFGNVNLIH